MSTAFVLTMKVKGSSDVLDPINFHYMDKNSSKESHIVWEQHVGE